MHHNEKNIEKLEKLLLISLLVNYVLIQKLDHSDHDQLIQFSKQMLQTLLEEAYNIQISDKVQLIEILYKNLHDILRSEQVPIKLKQVYANLKTDFKKRYL